MAAIIKINPDLLLKDELQYEIKIRSDLDTASLSVDDLRKKFRELVKEGTLTLRENLDLDPLEELATCERKLQELILVSKIEPASKKLPGRLSHLICRLERIVTNDVEGIRQKLNLLSQAFLVETSKKDIEITVPTVEEEEVVSMSNKKSFDFCKWNLCFDGRTPLYLFLLRVEELAYANNVSDRELLRGAVYFFRGEALTWYRNNCKDDILTWKILRQRLKEEFQPVGFERRLLLEIQGKLQGKDERVSTYINAMLHLFGLLSEDVSESKKLEVIMANLNTFYISKLTLVEINSVSQLKEVCMKFEITKHRTDNRGYLNPGKESVISEASGSANHAPKKVFALGKSLEKIVVSCLKCGGGHHYSQCLKIKDKCCFRCKKIGLLTKECDCNVVSKNE